MTEQAAIAEDLRMRILREPDVILEDPDVMRALITANDRAMGGNIVDLRGVAMERLEVSKERMSEFWVEVDMDQAQQQQTDDDGFWDDNNVMEDEEFSD